LTIKVQRNLKHFLCSLKFRIQYISANDGNENKDHYVQET